MADPHSADNHSADHHSADHHSADHHSAAPDPMADPHDETTPAAAGDDTPAKAPLPRWKRALLIAAGVFVATGLALLPFEGGAEGDLSTSAQQQAQDPGGERSPDTPDGLASGFDVGEPGPGPGTGGSGTGETGAGTGDDTERDLSPVFLKLGFSFFVGFAIGYAFRAFVKLALIFAGLQLLALFGLSYLDWVTVNWETMGAAWDRFVAGLGSEFETFRSFIGGSLPQASLATLGLFSGFKKN